ncbi:MAG: glycosyltransferase family 1 protein [Betaproteobacteria bacterium]|nr:glycosyltransferase family 1 protein [Betaproteobacteria bacterium]
MHEPNAGFPDAQSPPVQRLRVAVVTETYPPEVNGVAMTLGRLVDGLLARGHAVQLVRPRQAGDAVPRAAATARLEEVLVPGLPIPHYRGLQFGLAGPGRLARLWRGAPPDLVHVVTEGPLGWSAVSAARRLGLPLTSSFHTNFHAYSRHYGLRWLGAAIERHLRGLHNRTAATLVPTRALALELADRGYASLRVVARGVDTALYSPARRSAELRESWGVQSGAPVVMYVGRLAAEKNIDEVLQAWRAISTRVPAARMVFVGDGPLRASLQSDCPEAVFAGVQKGEALATHYASADLFLFPSLTETFGNVTSEALASGLCVLAYARAAAAELIVDGVNGRTLAPGTPGAYASAAAELVADPGRMSAMRAQAVASIAHLDWERVHDAFASVLAEVVTRRALAAAALRPGAAAAGPCGSPSPDPGPRILRSPWARRR